MISSELPEVLGTADRVLVLREGRPTAELSRAEADEKLSLAPGFPDLRPPGTPLGPLLPEVAAETGLDRAAVSLVGSHDTASAVAGVCQLAADACGLPVVAGPVEAAAYGNVLVQARTAGVLSGSLAELRALLPAADTRTYRPR